MCINGNNLSNIKYPLLFTKVLIDAIIITLFCNIIELNKHFERDFKSQNMGF